MTSPQGALSSSSPSLTGSPVLPPLGALEILAAGTTPFVFLDGDFRIRFVNPAAEVHFGRDGMSLYGHRAWEVWPGTHGAQAEQEYRRAMRDQVSVTFADRHAEVAVDRQLEVTAYPAAGGLAVFIRDVTREHQELEEAREAAVARWEESVELSQRNQELTRLNASLSYARAEADRLRERTGQVLDSAGDIVCAFDAAWRWTFINEAGRLLVARLGYPADPMGQCVWDALPQLSGTRFETELLRAVSERRSVEFEEFLANTGEWMESRVVPLPDGTVHVFWREITARHRQAQALRHEDERLRALVHAATQMIWYADAEGQIVDAPFWHDLTGQANDSARGRGWLDALHPDDRGPTDAAVTAAVASGTGFERQFRLRLGDGSYRWHRAKAGPVRNADGSVREWVGLLNEVDRMIRRDEGYQFLVDAGTALTETLDEQATLDTLARLAVDHIADGAMITLVRADGGFEQVATRSRDGRTGEYAAETERMYPLPADAPSGYPRAIRTGEAELIPAESFRDDVLPTISADAAHLERLRALDMYSGMVVPLVARGGTLGAMTLVLHGPDRRRAFDAHDLAIATELGRRAALALDNARLFDAERGARTDAAIAAERIQAVADAARAFAEAAGDPVRIADVLAEILTRRIGDSCAVMLAGTRDGLLTPAALRHRNAANLAALSAAAGNPRVQITEGLTQQLSGSGTSVVLSGDALRQDSESIAAVYGPLIDTGRVSTVLAVALRNEGRIVGTVVLGREGEGQGWQAGDVALVRELTDRAALLLERARLFVAERAARDEAERAAELTRRMQEITASFARTISVNDVAATTLSHGLDALSAQSGLVYLMNESGDAMELVRREGIPDDTLRNFQRIPLDAPVPVADAVRRGEIVCLADRSALLREYPDIAGITARMGADAWATVPLHHGGRKLGAIALGFAEAHEFGTREHALLDALGRHCAQAMERARLLDAERDARDDAERANLAKSDLLAKVSHETRQPVHASIGWVDTMEMELQGPITEPQREALRRIKQNQLRLLTVLNDLLDMSRIEAGRLELDMRDIRVADVVDAVESAVAPQMRAKGIHFDFARPGAGLMVRADVDQVIGILTNLLSNAAKFTASGGSVHVVSTTVDDTVRIAVRDTGIGIPPGLLDRVFEPFFQVESGFTRTTVGTGLGLAISREAARAMGGDVRVESEVGAGSCFTVVLQRAG